ncbi:Spy/CpxP family protein refolding chaperone [Pleurocapsales cyanobacterium LEGE 10410]|nr:Spy/CpxP family protein refolding chaperone [Pleurocapsales cyanobacterium LEGE 10410]
MNWRTFSVATAALLFIPLGSYAAQQNRETINIQDSAMQIAQVKHGDKWGRGRGMDRLLQQLELSDEQSQQIEAIRNQSKTENEALYQQLQTNSQEMRSLLASDADTAQLQQQHQQLQDLRQQLGDRRFTTMLEVREVLTPEQRAEWAELTRQYRDRGGNRNRMFR